MWAELRLRTESERHDECRERLLQNLSADRTPILVPAGGKLSGVRVEGPPGSDVATRVQIAVRALPRDLWDAIDPCWKLDDEAADEIHRTSDRDWNNFWQRARERDALREAQARAHA
jgi:hypothetical protein